MKPTFALVILLSFASCKENEVVAKKMVQNFDKIEHYHLNRFTSRELELMVEFRGKRQSSVLEVLYDQMPHKISDTTIVTKMQSVYSVKTIPSQLHSDIIDLLSQNLTKVEEASFSSTVLACEPAYRDVLIFRRKGKIIGIAKICFACDMNYMIDEKNVSYLNVELDYDKLAKFLLM